MEPVTLIVAALSAGAAAGLSDTTATAVKDAYLRLKTLTAARLSGGRATEAILAGHAADPAAWEAPLTRALLESGADTDPALLLAARTLLERTGGATGGHQIILTDAQGVHLGDHGVQNNRWGA